MSNEEVSEYDLMRLTCLSTLKAGQLLPPNANVHRDMIRVFCAGYYAALKVTDQPDVYDELTAHIEKIMSDSFIPTLTWCWWEQPS